MACVRIICRFVIIVVVVHVAGVEVGLLLALMGLYLLGHLLLQQLLHVNLPLFKLLR